MLGHSLALALAAVVAGAHACLPDEAPAHTSRRLGRERAGLVTFALGTLGAAAGLLHVSHENPSWLPGAVVLAGWMALRLGTRSSRPRRLVLCGTASNLAAIVLAAAWAGLR